MITVDEELTRDLSRRRAGSVPDHADVGHVMRTTGIKAVTLPDGEAALGWDMHDGTWGVLRAAGGDLRGPDWIGGVVEAEEGRGFLTSEPASLWNALRNALTMPSPVLEDGSVLDLRVSDSDEATVLRDGAPAAAPKH